MSTKSKKINTASELRQDTVSGDWVLLAPGRARRPEFLRRETKKVKRLPISKCPFDNPQKFGNAPAVLVYQNKTGTDWFLQVIPNKYPAVSPGHCGSPINVGPYKNQKAIGSHEVIILRDHDRHISRYGKEELKMLLLAYQDRYKSLAKEKCIEYVSIFHNYGEEAGASIPHTHSQILALSVVPPDVGHSVRGSRDYFHQNGKCIHCEMIAYELKDKKRIIYENRSAVVFSPYVSRSNFEVRVFPKRHEAYFEKVDGENNELLDVADAMRYALLKIYKNLNDPAFNFFLHTAPAVEKLDYGHYHWHFEIIPKSTVLGGFDIGTGIDILTVLPEEAARILRK
jgi:UDPglucose--hexose-1-phosphate uridylyltransferase